MRSQKSSSSAAILKFGSNRCPLAVRLAARHRKDWNEVHLEQTLEKNCGRSWNHHYFTENGKFPKHSISFMFIPLGASCFTKSHRGLGHAIVLPYLHSHARHYEVTWTEICYKWKVDSMWSKKTVLDLAFLVNPAIYGQPLWPLVCPCKKPTHFFSKKTQYSVMQPTATYWNPNPYNPYVHLPIANIGCTDTGFILKFLHFLLIFTLVLHLFVCTLHCNTGVRQGCISSPLIFSQVIDYVWKQQWNSHEAFSRPSCRS